MMRTTLFTQAEKVQTLAIEQIAGVLREKRDILWLDFASESIENCKPILENIFNFHPLAIDDALHENHVPKVDNWDTYLFMVLRSARNESQDSLEILTLELDIFLGPNYLVTFHKDSIAGVDTIWDLCQQDQRYLSKGTGYLLYQIADEIVTNTMMVIEDMDEQIDQIEDEIFDDPQPAILEQIFSVKRGLLGLRRSLLPQREVFNKLARGDFDLIPEHDRVYFRDVYDHMVRMQEINESLRDLVSGALETYLSVVNNRMNGIMKVLTIIATIFIPLSFFTGIYGMNFVYMPELHWRWGYFLFLSILGMIFIGMLIFFKRKRWI
ncbi:MAG: magnesium/cobalt transporter CorA [Anaerolineales bacterium]|nr:magnesium/cobalt transporter CorA [Anaerolineales bacterium]